MATDSSLPVDFWEQRADRYAGLGAGLAAVCAYGMPDFYNTCIDWTQRLALRRWTRVRESAEVLDVGCGVGRWSLRLAARGARVTGVDWSESMLAEARRRADAVGRAGACTFLQQDVTELDTGHRYDLVLGVTVLQHVLDPARLETAIRRLAAHIRPDGRLVLLEVAPSRPNRRCDTATFRARTAETYLEHFDRAGLALDAVTGVDPAPFRIQLLPYYRRWPRPVGVTAMVAAAGLCLPIDAIAGRRLPGASWHKVFVLRRTDGARRG